MLENGPKNWTRISNLGVGWKMGCAVQVSGSSSWGLWFSNKNGVNVGWVGRNNPFILEAI